jgi:hypothetical protein
MPTTDLNQAKPKRGGKRSGSGRPAAQDSRRINTILPVSIIERAREIGGGNVSKGLALAVAAYLASADKGSWPRTEPRNP